MPIYGHEALVICHPYIADIPRYMQFAIFGSALKKTRPTYWKALLSLRGPIDPLRHFNTFILRLVVNLLNNKTSILLNLAEYRLILANLAYGLVGKVTGEIYYARLFFRSFSVI